MTQLLKNNHKSGINENNVAVATATSEQPQTRAINPDVLHFLPVAPITASVQVYQVSVYTGQATYGDYSECSKQNHIFCKVTVTANAKFKTISKALLKIEKRGGDDTGFVVRSAGENVILATDESNYLKTVTQNGKTYVVVDVSDYVKEGISQVFYIAIESKNGNQINLYNNATVEVAYIEDDDLIASGKIEKQVGAQGGYSVNARNGKLQYSQQVYASKGGIMPFGLSLAYNASGSDESSPNGVNNGMKGWTFNYQQSLKSSLLDTMLYVDASNVVHTFKMATNNSSVWYDATGKNGMVLVATETGYTISDGQKTTLNFDTSKRLVSIVERVSNSKTVSTTVEYLSDGKISKVTDGCGDVYNFTWTDALVQIKKADVLVAEITLASQRVTQVKYCLSDDVVSFAYDETGRLASVLDSASHQKAVFDYNNVDAVSAVKNYVSNVGEDGQSCDVATDSNHFDYKLLQTRVASCRNSDNKYNAYCTMAYLFAEDGELLTTAEVEPGGLQPLHYRTKKDFEKTATTVPDKFFAQATFGGNETIATEATTNTSIESDNIAVDTTNQVFNTFCFSAAACIVASDNVSNDGSQKLTLQIKEGTNVLGEAQFDPSKREAETVSGLITLSKGMHNLKAVLVFSNITAKLSFGNVRLYTTKSGVQRQCVNAVISDESISEHDGTNTILWRNQQYCTLLLNGEVAAEQVVFTSKDHALTLISRLKNPTAFNVWYNDGQNMLYQVSNVSLQWGNVSKTIAEVSVCTVSSTLGKTIFQYLAPCISYLYKTRKVTTVSTANGLDGVVAEEWVNGNFQTAKAIDEKGVSTDYYHDENGNVTKVTVTAPVGTLLNLEENYTYSDKNMLLSSSHRRDFTDYTQSYLYGNDYELAQETQPNDQTTTFSYSADKNKLTGISSTQDNQTSENTIAYQGDLVETLSDSRTIVDFEYDERQNISQVEIANTAVLSKAITYDEVGTTQSVTTFGNGQKIKKYYDKYDRLVKVSDVTGSEIVLVQNVYNDEELDQATFDVTTFTPTASANSPLRVVVDNVAGTTTWFTYDEFGQAKKTESENLCVVRTLDNFGRLSRYESSADETDVYVVNNLSYASETDDTVVSEQVQYVSEDTQGDSLATIATTYAKDDLQRPTSTTVMQGNFGFRYNCSYVPRRTKTWVSNNGQVAYALPIKDGHWEFSDVGTTQYVSQFKQYNVSVNEETLVATDNLEYDANGNITKYGNVTYKYDKFNRLVRENNPTLDKTTTWCYDVSGNVCSRTEYSYTTGAVGTPVATFNYAYGNGWKDQLTAYNGQSITYDQAGNPTSYLGKTLGWTRGRLLASCNSVSMQYDANGIRTRKVVPATNGSTTTEYVYAGNNLLQEKVELANTTDYKYFLYNSQGVVGFVLNGTTYLFRKNFFGDVTAIYCGATKVAEYAYDAWGNCTIVSDTNGIGTANPFRYRGYFWDNDLQLYYLMSRYYDPQVGRFLNADGLEYLAPETLGGLNLYAYCLNNPIKYSDKYGFAPDWINWLILPFLSGLQFFIFAAAEIGTALKPKSDNIVYYDDVNQLVSDWTSSNYSSDIEHASMIISKEVDGKTVYYHDRVYDGTKYGIAWGFFCSFIHYYVRSALSGEKVCGFVHSHPSGNKKPSPADEFILKLMDQQIGYIATSSSTWNTYTTSKTFWQALWDMLIEIKKYI